VAAVRVEKHAVDAPNVVTISRTLDGWQAVVAGHGLVAARSLQALDNRIRGLTAGGPVTYQFRTGNDELDRLVGRLRITRAAARRYEEEARHLVDQVVLLQSGLSQRDMSVLVGLSHQRVYQLRARRPEPTAQSQTRIPTSGLRVDRDKEQRC